MNKLQLRMAWFDQERRAKDLLEHSDMLKNQGSLREAEQAYAELVTALDRQLGISEESNVRFPESPLDIEPVVGPLVNAMLTRADVLESLGDRDEVEGLRRRGLELSGRYLGAVGLAERKRQLAASLQAQSRYHEAVVALMAAQDEFRARGDALKVAHVAADLAELLEWLGDDERARAESENARALIEPRLSDQDPSQRGILEALAGGAPKQAEERAELLSIWTKLIQLEARACRRLGDYDQALKLFRRALLEEPSVSSPALKFQLAATAIERGQVREGYQQLQEMAPEFTGLLRPKLGVLLSWQAKALLGLGEPAAALDTAEAACEELSQRHDPDALWKAWWCRGRALLRLGRTREALAALTEGTEIVTGLRRGPLGHRLDSTYLKDKLPLFTAAIELAARLDEAQTAGRLIEQVKSRSLTAILSVPRGEERPGGELESRFEELSRQVDALEYRGYREGESAETQQAKDVLLAERARIIERIRISEPRWRAMSEPVTFDLTGLLEHLAQREQAALTLFYQSEQVVGVLLQDRRCVLGTLPVRPETSAAVEAYQRNLQAMKSSHLHFDPASFPALDAAFLVPATLLESALRARTIVVIPHGLLHLIPWAALAFRGRRLFEHCPVGILPNLSCLPMLGVGHAPRPRVALIGAPDYRRLPKLETLFLSADELATIEAIHRNAGGVLDPVSPGARATEEAFWNLARRPDATGAILHIACHGDFVSGDPLNSGLLLTDGKVDAAEISRCPLSYEEVVLSSCASGYRPTEIQGVPLTGDDVVGLPGAFLEAGARSVLVSITKARDDAALRFMTLYHEERARGAGPLFALQQTQKEMLSSDLYPPHFWAGFTVYGCG